MVCGRRGWRAPPALAWRLFTSSVPLPITGQGADRSHVSCQGPCTHTVKPSIPTWYRTKAQEGEEHCICKAAGGEVGKLADTAESVYGLLRRSQVSSHGPWYKTVTPSISTW